jgi:type II secretory pathway pseudopilin PulG
MMRRKKTDRAVLGFSLLELCIVVAILMVLLAASVPTLMSTINNYKLTGATQSITWAIQSSRYQAIMKGYTYELTVTPSSNTYQILSRIPPATTFTNVGGTVPITSAPVTVSPSTTLQFSPNGSITVVTGNSNPNTIALTYLTKTQTITVTNYGSITVQ